jgi:hypothetical protein
METLDNTGLGLIRATIERVQNKESLFSGGLKKLVNSSEEELGNFLNRPKNQKKLVNSSEKELDNFLTKPKNQILCLLTTKNKLVIKATNSKRFLAEAEGAFKSGIDPNFEKWKLNQASYATPDTPTDVYELIADATFAQIFGLLSNDLDKLCLTQSQIEEFCLSYPNQLRIDDSTFFLFKENRHFFVARVSVYLDGLNVCVRRLENDCVWNGADHHHPHHVVVPVL